MRVLAWQVCTVMQAVKFSGGFLVSNSSRFRDVEIRAPRGTQLNAKSWMTEAPLRMLMNNLDPDVAENPKELVVYGGIGRAARNWECYDQIVESLKGGADFGQLALEHSECGSA